MSEETNILLIDFLGEKGLFSAQYAEENHFLFPSLKHVVEGIGEEKYLRSRTYRR